MDTFDSDFLQLAETMQNFFDAVANRCDAAVSDAAYQLEAMHRENAAIEAMTKACYAMREGEQEETRFWMRVYAHLIMPTTHTGGAMTFH